MVFKILRGDIKMSNMKNIYENLEDNNKAEIIELLQKQSLKDFLDYEEFEIIDIDSWD